MNNQVRRELWADSARGLAIIAVVLGHVFLQDDAAAAWTLWPPAQTAWLELRHLLLPVRMPLFFLIAGYFAAGVIRRPWPTVLRTRVSGLYYLYVVWLLAQTVYFLFVPHEGTAAATDLAGLVPELTYAPTNLWFLVALAVYFVIAKAGVRIAPAAIVASAWVSWSAFTDRLPEALERTPMPEYLVFFVIGAYAPGMLRRIPGSVLLATAGTAGLWAGVSAMESADERTTWAVFLLISTASGILGIVSLLKLLEARHSLPPLTVWIGRRTLPIYVVQLPLVVGIEALVDLLPPRAAQTLLGNPVISAVYPALVTALVIAVALLLHRVLDRWAPWMYRAPWVRSDSAVLLSPADAR